MKRIALTQGKYALVDDEDFERLNQFKWCANKCWNTFYAVRNLPKINGKRFMVLMHHEVIGKPPKGLETDHENGQGLDNQRKNLRFVTTRQNAQNRKNLKKSSQYPGIDWFKRNKKWRAHIRINGKLKYLGSFTNEFEAFSAYRQAVEAIGEEMVGEIKCP